MLRTTMGALAAVAALVWGAVGPVQAAPRADPVAGLAVHPEWGTIGSKNAVLRRGCHTYTYTYAVTPPEGIWALEVFISGPRLKHVAAGAFLDGYDPKTGTGRYTLCRAVTRYGTFRIQAKLSTDDGSGHITEGLLPTATFRLRAPHR